MRYAEKQLQHWGKWRLYQMPPELDFRHKNILYDVAETGGVRIKPTVRISENNERAEMVDTLLNQYRKHKPKVIKVLQCHYTEPGSIRRKAAKLRLPKSSYYDALQTGLRWLGYQLSYNKATLLELSLLRRYAQQ